MAAARIRFTLDYHEGVLSADLRELPEAILEAVDGALAAIQARKDEATPKGGRLVGACSTRFHANALESAPSGRIVYFVRKHSILVLAIHADHDEAYRRARARF